MKTRICHITSVHTWNDTRIFHKECCSLAKAGYEVFLIAPDAQEGVHEQVNVISVPKAKGRISRATILALKIYRKAFRTNAELIHFHDPELLWIGVLLRLSGRKVIFDVHEDVPKQIMDKHWIPKSVRGFVSRVYKVLEHLGARTMSGVISVTEIICGRFEKVNRKVEMVANYPLTQEAILIDTMDSERVADQICYIGGLFPTRGVKELIEALEFTNAKLVLAGQFAPASFEEEVKALPGWRKVNYVGFVGRKEIAEILKSSEAGIVTLHPTRSYVESLPIKMFEYMSAGLPVIASDFPMWKAIIDGAQCGLCADPMDPKDIADKINQVLADKETARRMGDNGAIAFKTKYNWTSQEEKLLRFYEQILSK